VDAAEVIAGLDSGLRQKLSLGSEVTTSKLALPSLGLTRALNGGFPYGRQVLVFGNKSSAKTSQCLEMVGNAQRDGKVCAWIDAEMSYDSEWATRLGVDTSQLIVSEARTVNDFVDVTVQLMNAGVDVIVVDSISSLLPAAYFEKKTDELKALEDTGGVGSDARDFSRAMKIINYANNRTKPTLLVLISQTRSNIGMMFTSQIPTGGQAVRFYSSIIIKLFSSEAEGSAILGKRQVGNKIIEENVGRKINWLVQFSKTSPAFVSGEFDFYFVGDNVGTDKEGEIIDIGAKYGVVELAGSWFKFGDKKVQGRSQAVDYLRHNPEVRDELERKIASA
jgi:recombination protein RecA